MYGEGPKGQWFRACNILVLSRLCQIEGQYFLNRLQMELTRTIRKRRAKPSVVLRHPDYRCRCKRALTLGLRAYLLWVLLLYGILLDIILVLSLVKHVVFCTWIDSRGGIITLFCTALTLYKC